MKLFCNGEAINIKTTRQSKILEFVNLQFGEIGDFLVEDGYISFEVYRGSYEEAPKTLQSTDGGIRLTFFDKFDDRFFTLVYKIN